MQTKMTGEVARFDDLRPGETVLFEDWPWPQTVARVETDGHAVTIYTEQGGRPYEGVWFSETTRVLTSEAGNVSAAYIIGCLLALLPGTLVAFVLGALAGAASGVA